MHAAFLTPTALVRYRRRPRTAPRSPGAPTVSRRRQLRACWRAEVSDSQPESSVDDFVSDTTHVVLDARDLPAVLDRLARSVEDDPDAWFDDFLAKAEEHADNKPDDDEADNAISPQQTAVRVENDYRSEVDSSKDLSDEEASSTTVGDGSDANAEGSESGPEAPDYFTPEFLPYMPRWARHAFNTGEKESLTPPPSKATTTRPRLSDLAEEPAGIVHCLLAHVADDYNVPVEFVVDASLALGVRAPVGTDDCIKQRFDKQQIDALLKLLSSFDSFDLADRYSDRSLHELAEDYDLDPEYVIDACESEGFHVCCGLATRLSLVQEDRILDIMLKGGPTGKPYPSALEGLT